MGYLSIELLEKGYELSAPTSTPYKLCLFYLLINFLIFHHEKHVLVPYNLSEISPERLTYQIVTFLFVSLCPFRFYYPPI